ncbi:ISL3 family transposase [Nonomuraea aurantiaca]|uniref:ISL3 family transposase n=1 Tax=Nonomuraea aurantiaca TaxID=2878562 RepID=UPI001CDA4B0F|nr:ISL3 family transposase [Nonomuraea aurantiaca]MCA2230500.1 ISL3 family transposase [Nonomuraea aurantiaca]
MVHHAEQSAGQSCLEVLLPHLSALVIEETADRGTYVLIRARTQGGPACCPRCGMTSSRLHGHYRRLLQDLPAGGRPVLIALSVRRLKCENRACEAETFAEPIAGLAVRHARNTSQLRRMLELFALALAGRAASRLADMIGITVSRDTLIRLIRALPEPALDPVTVLGIDDWAKRKGHSYATLLVNMETGQPIDVLDDRTADTVTAWLHQHPEIKVICRDRAGAYAEAARAGAPQATEVADRWHLWHNLCRAAEHIVRAHRADLLNPIDPNPPLAPATADAPSTAPIARAPSPEGEAFTASRTKERHALIQQLVHRGLTVTAIAEHLGLDRKTVRKYRDATSPEQLINGRRHRTRAFEQFAPYLQQRIRQDGITNAAELFAELHERGYRGSRRTVRRYLAPLRAAAATPDLPPAPPTVREATRWITSHPDHLTAQDETRLDALLKRSPTLSDLARHVTALANMMMKRTGATNLKPWLAAVQADGIPQLHSFAHGIERDLDAVTNGLSLPFSSGAVEGNVTRVKALKRSRYGRANFDLLRKIILCNRC